MGLSALEARTQFDEQQLEAFETRNATGGQHPIRPDPSTKLPLDFWNLVISKKVDLMLTVSQIRCFAP